MKCGLRHFGDDVMQLSYKRWPTAPLFFVKIHPSFGEFAAPLRHILSNHNFTINSKKSFVNFRWTFTFCVEKSYDGTHLAFGGALDRRAISNTSHSKPLLPFPNEHGSQVKDQGRRKCCHNKHKIFPIGLHVKYLYFPDTHLTNTQ